MSLRAETLRVSSLNDIPLHASMVRWAEGRLEAGASPVDGWFPAFGMGFPQFHHYQSLPHLLTALPATIVGGDRAVAWTTYLLLALWPVSVYAGARLLDWGGHVAGVAALVSPLLVSAPGYGYELSSYTWLGFGAWSQLWGMVLLPLACGLGWQAVARTRWVPLAALVLSVTITSHLLTGYLALLLVGCTALVTRQDLGARLLRALAIGAGGVLLSAWLLVPVLTDASWANYVGYDRGTFYYDSFGARRVLGWLLDGSLFDEGRLPVVTALVVVGFAAAARRARSDVRARFVIASFALSTLLYCGRPTLGPLLRLLPGSRDLFLHRFIIGVHLSGIVLAGIGTTAVVTSLSAALRRSLASRSERPVPSAALRLLFAGLIIALLAPAWTERRTYATSNADFVERQQLADAGDGADLAFLIEDVRRRGDGRVYAGTPSNWGRSYRVGYVPVYAALINADVASLGSTLRVSSLSTATELLFDETKADHYRIFGVRYVLTPADRPPPLAASLLRSSGRHRLWLVTGGGGYFDVVDADAALRADRTTLATTVAPWLSGVAPAARRPTVAFSGSPTVMAGPDRADPPGSVTPLVIAPDEGTFAARASLSRSAVVVLSSSFHRRWRVVVDGRDATPVLVAPSFVGVAVGPGDHDIVFRYRSHPASSPLLLLAVVAAIAATAALSWRRFRVQRCDD